MGAPGTFHAWARFAALLGGAALAFDMGATAVGPAGDAALFFALACLGFLSGMLALGAACIARAYWTEGDGQVSGGKRFGLGCLVPLALAGFIFLSWGAWFLWLWRVPESLWMWTVVGPPLLGTVERLAAPSLGVIPRGPDHSPDSRANRTS